MRMLITGAASGIGRAVALLAAELPAARLVLIDRNPDRLDVVADEARRRGGEAVAVAIDLQDPHECARSVETAHRVFGGLDTLVSNAGISPAGPLSDVTVAEFDRVFAVNTRPLLLLAQAARPMLQASQGSIVSTVSLSAGHATPHLGVYSASKAALLMLVRQIALEWGEDGIRCNAVSPGPTLTGLTAHAFDSGPEGRRAENRRARESHIPLRRVSEATDIARAVLFLASEDARQITGVDLAVDGGLGQALMASTGGGSGYSR
jgi:NAD(P)-dependent dehydrogenase (short-subunit alcohol dehydrogenase family)